MRRSLVCGMPCIVFLSIVALLPEFAAAVDVPKWSTYDFTFDSGAAYTDGYSAGPTSFSATFTGPGGVTKTVPGFWDGGDVFKVRFTPTVEGNWSYTTSSSDADLLKTESFTVSTPKAGNHGFLRIDPSYSNSFVWDDGTRNFMWGQSYYDVLGSALVNNNWKAAVDNSASYGMNKVRVNLYAQGGYSGGPNHGYPDAQPYTAYTGTTNPNRDSLNLSYWQKLDEIIQYHESKGMVTDLILVNPYLSNRAFGTDTQNDRFVKYAVARYAAYHNVIWCLSNEWDLSEFHYGGTYPQNKADFNRMGGLVRNNDPWVSDGGRMRPLSIHPRGEPIGFAFFGETWPTHAILQYGGWNQKPGGGQYQNGDEWGNAGIVYNLGHNMPVVNDEYGYVGQTVSPIDMNQTKLRGAIWGIATAGGYGSSGDWRTFTSPAPNWNASVTGEWADAPGEYGDIKRMVDFFTTKGIEYWKMGSHNELKAGNTRAYLLAEPGRQYVAYAAVGGTFSLTVAPGTYHAYLYNPRTGVETPWTTPTITRTTTGSQSFTMPDSTNDWVIRLTTIPEPGTLVLLGVGLAPMAVYRWRRHRL